MKETGAFYTVLGNKPISLSWGRMLCVDLQNVKDNVNDDVMTRHDEYYIDHFHHHDYRHHHEIIGV